MGIANSCLADTSVVVELRRGRIEDARYGMGWEVGRKEQRGNKSDWCGSFRKFDLKF